MGNTSISRKIGGGASGYSTLSGFWCGFTLAEVLITLGIIGIVAAMTLPTLIGNYQKKETIEKLRTAYNLFSNAIERAKLDNGGYLTVTPDMIKGEDIYSNKYKFTEKYLDPYFKKVKRYNGKAIRIRTPGDNYGIIAYAGNNHAEAPLCLQNGMCYWVNGYGAFGTSTSYNYILLYIDINGPKKPNIMGRDVFTMGLKFINGNQVIGLSQMAPHFNNLSTSRESLKSRCNKTSAEIWNGVNCFALIVKDDWTIKDDYPW